MLLNNLTLINESNPVTISITDEKITAIERQKETLPAENFALDFTDAFAFPGLINSHDHLDFNCFSPLGRSSYNNYTEWGNHIHAAHKTEIDAVLKIPQRLRADWGMYKNLLAGVTSVVNHGAPLKIEHPLINIYQETQNLHSVQFEKNWRWQLNNPLLKNKACVIHAGEGTDTLAVNEIDELLRWNLLNKKITAVHAVAMNSSQAKKINGIVWCPESNKLLLNKHAAINLLKEHTAIVFGTDSTLTGHWNIWHHLRLARATKMLTDEELFHAITKKAAALWGMNNGELKPGTDADIVIAKKNNACSSWDSFYCLDPSAILMVIHKGKIRLFDQIIASQVRIQLPNLPQFSKIVIQDTIKFVQGDLPALINDIRNYNSSIHLPVAVCELHKNTINA